MSKLTVLANKALTAAKPHLNKFWYYAKVELAPPKLSEVPAIPGEVAKLIAGFKKGNWKNVTVKEATLNTLVSIEVLCWFFIGECIGKRGIIGYKL